jgi:CheY-like chemotaxis protein
MDHQPSLAGAFAHELRNALSPARAALELLQRREAANEALQPALRTMERSFAATLQTIDRFVDAARILDGTVKLEVVPGNLGGLLERASDLAKDTLAERGHQVSANLGVDALINGDSARLAQVLAQLVENASVNAPEGGMINVYASSDDQTVTLVVRDPAPRLDDFDPAHALASLRAAARTHGLALATARRLMELQRGALTARVDAESGCAEFVMTITRAPEGVDGVSSAAVQRLDSPSFDRNTEVDRDNRRMPQRILLVDDNQAVRDIYREALEELGYNVTLAANGEEALHFAERSVPEVALIDVHLPTLNGYQLARALRARHPSSGIKLVLLSGMTLDDDMIRLSKNAGFDHCVDKGAGPKAIDALLRE